LAFPENSNEILGSMQIQVAKALDADVATTVRSDAKGEFAKTLGADLVINTRKEDFVECVKAWTGGAGADVVIDNLSGDVLAKSIDATKPMGVVVAFGFSAGPEVKFDIRVFSLAKSNCAVRWLVIFRISTGDWRKSVWVVSSHYSTTPCH